MSRAGVVAWRGRRIHPKLGHEPGANIVIVKIAADAELLQLDFLRPEKFTRPAHRVIRRMVEVENIVGVSSDLRRKKFRVPIYILGAGIAV